MKNDELVQLCPHLIRSLQNDFFFSFCLENQFLPFSQVTVWKRTNQHHAMSLLFIPKRTMKLTVKKKTKKTLIPSVCIEKCQKSN